MMNAAEEVPTQAPAAPATPAPPASALAPAVNDPRRKKPFLASFLSIIPGLGQVYVGYYKRGFINAIVVAVLVTLLASRNLDSLIPLVAIFLAFFWLYNLVDAGRRAALYNQVLAGGGEIELPDDFQAPGLRGSIVGGTVLMLVGFVVLLNTRFGVSLDWLENWWPVAVIAFGGYLVYKAMQEKSDGDSGSFDE